MSNLDYLPFHFFIEHREPDWETFFSCSILKGNHSIGITGKKMYFTNRVLLFRFFDILHDAAYLFTFLFIFDVFIFS